MSRGLRGLNGLKSVQSVKSAAYLGWPANNGADPHLPVHLGEIQALIFRFQNFFRFLPRFGMTDALVFLVHEMGLNACHTHG